MPKTAVIYSNEWHSGHRIFVRDAGDPWNPAPKEYTSFEAALQGARADGYTHAVGNACPWKGQLTQIAPVDPKEDTNS